MIVWLCSYPRSGNTMLRMMLKSVFGQQTYSRYDDRFDIASNTQTADLVGHVDLGGSWDEIGPRLRASDETYFVKTHEVPENGERAIYVVRDGRAAAVSYLKYFTTYFGEAKISLDEVIAGFVNYGSWSSHLDACDPIHRPGTLLLRYEELLSEPNAQLEKIASFCNLPQSHDWKNNFEEAKALNPQFFREGSALRSISDVSGDNLAIFWLLHEKWMRRLGYLNEEIAPGADLDAAHRALWRLVASQNERSIELTNTRNLLGLETARADGYRRIIEQHQQLIERQQLELNRIPQIEQDLAAARESSHIYAADRDLWAQRAHHFERQLQTINEMPWHRRLADTAIRIAKNARAALVIPKLRPDAPLPRITIVTPVYNGEAHIRDTIESVLSQDYLNLQYIICDGGSTDGTMKIVDEYRERLSEVISEPDKGMYDAIAKGFAAADGQIFGYLNADDMYESGGLLRVGHYFAARPHAHVIYHEDTVAYNGWRFPNAIQPPKIDRLTMLKGHVLFQDGVFFSRRAYEAVGGVNRAMRLAGDWDLWVRLSSRYKFHRVSGHVSCFRMRPGQLSENMTAYNAELETSRAEWKRRMGARRLFLSQPMHWCRRAYNAVWRLARPRKFFYPLQGANLAQGPIADERSPQLPIRDLKSPLSKTPPDRLLFSSPDTRFGYPLVNHVYYSSADDVAVVWPPVSKQELTGLYEKFYSNPPKQIVQPPEGKSSPWRNYFGGSLLEKLIPRIPMKAWGIVWGEQDCGELLENLPWLPRRGAKIQMLDVGCFEGKLLDAIKTQTDWETFGIDPNPTAIQAAQAKGHQAFIGSAEDAVLMIPEGLQFDVIHLGQTIEHLDDPLSAVRRLGLLLKPDGVLVLSTPNLDSKQIELFGPTWAHWHLPYHRHLFSRKSLRKMGELSGLKMIGWSCYSHPYWTAMTVALNRIGVAGSVSHTAPFSDPEIRDAIRYTVASRFLWNWRGKGDYLVVVYRRLQ